MKSQFKGIIVIILFVIFLSPASSSVFGEIYKWKDKDGNMIFSDTPPPSGVDVEVKEFKEDIIEKPKAKENINIPRPKSESSRRRDPIGISMSLCI